MENLDDILGDVHDAHSANLAYYDLQTIDDSDTTFYKGVPPIETVSAMVQTSGLHNNTSNLPTTSKTENSSRVPEIKLEPQPAHLVENSPLQTPRKFPPSAGSAAVAPPPAVSAQSHQVSPTKSTQSVQQTAVAASPQQKHPSQPIDVKGATDAQAALFEMQRRQLEEALAKEKEVSEVRLRATATAHAEKLRTAMADMQRERTVFEERLAASKREADLERQRAAELEKRLTEVGTEAEVLRRQVADLQRQLLEERTRATAAVPLPAAQPYAPQPMLFSVENLQSLSRMVLDMAKLPPSREQK